MRALPVDRCIEVLEDIEEIRRIIRFYSAPFRPEELRELFGLEVLRGREEFRGMYRVRTERAWMIINPVNSEFVIFYRDKSGNDFFKRYDFFYPETIGEFILYCERCGMKLEIRREKA